MTPAPIRPAVWPQRIRPVNGVHAYAWDAYTFAWTVHVRLERILRR